MKKLQLYYQQNPLAVILLVAFAARLLAVLFARGYMMHDDHFLTIEPSGSWAAGKNFNNWLPGIGNTNEHPEPISFFYLGFLFSFFKFFQFIGLEDPASQMLGIRFIHGIYSLLTIYFSYRITEILSNKRNAITVGWLLALIAIMPNFSVRNLVELVCMPPLTGGLYLLLKHINLKSFRIASIELQPHQAPDAKRPLRALLLAAIVLGLAVGIRFQTGLFVALIGLILLLQHSFLYACVFGLVSFAAFFLTQIDDVLLWGGQPFQHLQGYFAYNKEHAFNYPGSPFAYLSFIGVFILPPVSLFLLFGFLRSWKKHALIFLPTLGFLLFHILYPNRQERFILPVLPFFVMLGVIGWNNFLETKNTGNFKKLVRAGWIFFWSLNLAGMLVLCFTYTKKSRVEAMSYIYHQGDCRNFALEFTHSSSGAMVPQFYSGVWTSYYYWGKGEDPVYTILNMEHNERMSAQDLQPRPVPNYFLFYDDENLEARVERIRKYFPGIRYATTIHSGWFDRMLHTLNPKNSLEEIYIFKVDDTGQKTPVQ